MEVPSGLPDRRALRRAAAKPPKCRAYSAAWKCAARLAGRKIRDEDERVTPTRDLVVDVHAVRVHGGHHGPLPNAHLAHHELALCAPDAHRRALPSCPVSAPDYNRHRHAVRVAGAGHSRCPARFQPASQRRYTRRERGTGTGFHAAAAACPAGPIVRTSARRGEQVSDGYHDEDGDVISTQATQAQLLLPGGEMGASRLA